MIVEIGPYCMVIVGDVVSVTDVREPLDLDDDSGWALPETKVPGLAKHVAKDVGFRLVHADDMPIIYIIEKGHKYGRAYAINLAEPMFSEWGDCGITIPKGD